MKFAEQHNKLKLYGTVPAACGWHSIGAIPTATERL